MQPNVSLTIENTNGGINVRVENKLQILSETYAQENTLIGDIDLLVENTESFSPSNILLYSQLGAENAEFSIILNVNDTENITVDALSQNHNRGEILARVMYNQIVIESSPDNATWSPVTTLAIDPTKLSTTYFHQAGLPSTYYRVAYRNSVIPALSNYSDPLQAQISTQEGTVAELIGDVRSEMGISPDDPSITTEFLLATTKKAIEKFKSDMFGFKLNELQEFEHPITIYAGRNFIDLPSDIDFSFTDQSTLALRLPTDNLTSFYPVNYVDKRFWNDYIIPYNYSYVASEALIGSTTLTLVNTGNLPQSGTIQVACNGVNDQIINVSYTGNDVATNTLTGVSGITRVLPVGTQVWVTFGFGYPVFFTIFEQKIWLSAPLSNEVNGRTAMLDYYKEMQNVTSINDDIIKRYKFALQSYVSFLVNRKKDSGIDITNDPYYKEYSSAIQQLQDGYYTGQYGRVITS